MAETYPITLPAVLINSNGYSPQQLTFDQPVSYGAPIFRQQYASGWLMFNCAFSFNESEKQIFTDWYENTILRGSESFVIGLMIDGFNGSSNTVDHECYMQGTPTYAQKGTRWGVSVTLLAKKYVGLSECDALTLINSFNVFKNFSAAPNLIADAVETIETLWAV